MHIQELLQLTQNCLETRQTRADALYAHSGYSFDYNDTYGEAIKNADKELSKELDKQIKSAVLQILYEKGVITADQL